MNNVDCDGCASSIINYEKYLRDIIKHRWQDEEGRSNPLQENTFFTLNPRHKVEVLHALCGYRLDGEDVFDTLRVG